jgi:hypothetical protein
VRPAAVPAAASGPAGGACAGAVAGGAGTACGCTALAAGGGATGVRGVPARRVASRPRPITASATTRPATAPVSHCRRLARSCSIAASAARARAPLELGGPLGSRSVGASVLAMRSRASSTRCGRSCGSGWSIQSMVSRRRCV